MSDPAKNAEVEDVLSSIRRLVSEDKRPMQTPKPAAFRDRLVLTPDHRVEDASKEIVEDASKEIVEDVTNKTAEDAADQPGADASKDTVEGATDANDVDRFKVGLADHVVSQNGKKTHSNFEDRFPQGLEVAEHTNFDDASDSRLSVASPSADESDTVEHGDSPVGEKADPSAHLEEQDAVDTTSASVRFAILGSNQLDAPDDPFDFAGPFGLEDDYNDDPYDFDKTEPEPESTAIDDTDLGPSLDVPTTPAWRHGAYSGATTEGDSSLSQKIEALETVVGKLPDDWEPDSAGADDYAGTEFVAMAWEDDDPEFEKTLLDIQADDTEVSPEVAYEIDEPGEDPSQDGMSAAPPVDTEDQVLDEEALRDLVSEIVREELQGALGERITRNVRKLVRREIRRALTAQDLD